MIEDIDAYGIVSVSKLKTVFVALAENAGVKMFDDTLSVVTFDTKRLAVVTFASGVVRLGIVATLRVVILAVANAMVKALRVTTLAVVATRLVVRLARLATEMTFRVPTFAVVATRLVVRLARLATEMTLRVVTLAVVATRLVVRLAVFRVPTLAVGVTRLWRFDTPCTFMVPDKSALTPVSALEAYTFPAIVRLAGVAFVPIPTL